jgi:hypothetical protein
MENNDKIEDNASFKDLKKTIEGFDALKGLANFFSAFGLKNEEMNNALKEFDNLKNQFDALAKTPDKFNTHFAKKGWIAHESMNQDLILECIKLAEDNDFNTAEENLISYYTSSEMYWLVSRLQGIEAFRKRHTLLNFAYQDTLEERYYSAIPIVLMMMDGAVNDINKTEGFFAEKSDLTAWDSIAAHSTGLMTLKDTLGASRKKTSEDVISMPFRNGILHGRDLGYANRTVAAKSWAALFAVNDWARSIEDGKKVAPPPKPEPTFMEQLESIATSIKSLEESKISQEKASLWTPRSLVVSVDIPEKAESINYADHTPEQEAIRFTENWQKKRYDLIAREIHQHYTKNINYKTEAGKVRQFLGDKHLLDYKILKVVDCAPAISEVTLDTLIFSNEIKYHKEITLRLIYQDGNGRTLVFGDKNGKWLFIDAFFYTLDYFS